MKKQSGSAYLLRLALTLLLITAAVAALLSGVNALTAQRIAELQAEKTHQAIVEVLPNGGTDPQILPVNEDIVKTLYITDGGYAVEVAPVGFDSALTMMVGIVDGKVTGISIISHSETPGLGAVAAADTDKGQAFRDQFIGASESLGVTKDGGTVEAITSATITSRAVTAGVNAALDYVKALG